MLCWHSLAGVAPGGAAQSRGERVNAGGRRKPSRVVRNRAEGFLVQDAFPALRRAASAQRNPGAEALGIKNARLPNVLFPFADQLPQRRSWLIEEALHPGAFASRIVILFRRRTRGNRAGGNRAGAAIFDGEIAALIASF